MDGIEEILFFSTAKHEKQNLKANHHKMLFFLYEQIWGIAIPFLSRNPRIAEGFAQRTLRHPLPYADLWIQSASVGEAWLTAEIIKNLHPHLPLNVLITSNTRQGIELLEKLIAETSFSSSVIGNVCTAYFPFDRPSLMKKAVKQVRPKLMILLETEIWPGLLAALKQSGTRILILNGRISPRSLQRYRLRPSVWKSLRPDQVLAVSLEDAERFGLLFGRENIGLMSNIKFDRIPLHMPGRVNENFIRQMIVHPFLVLGSVRREEEMDAENIIRKVHTEMPETVTGLFPRHFHRLEYWKKTLVRMCIPWCLRSGIKGPVSSGTVILWDTLGELLSAYEAADAAFVGGSLAPLGGQNFIEPLVSGLRPVIGPYWNDFAWVGREIFDRGLVRIAETWKNAADFLIHDLSYPVSKASVRESARKYLEERRGGTAQACQVIERYANECFWPARKGL
ncbi:MAG: 3-deoxy-D-manno-octulosonic acid transferase [Desulfococcaceae bacterium]